jgi:hypothetical protein
MAAWLFAYATALVAAFAETPSLGLPTPQEMQAIRDSNARYVAQCLRDWDKETHMSKEERKRACQRLADDREDYMLEYPTSKTTPEG